jgi:hypothetical protein
MPDAQRIRQLRQWGSRSIVTRHSKQIPIPQRVERGSPVTDLRQADPASATATATVDPTGTTTALPSTEMLRCLAPPLACAPFRAVTARERLYKLFFSGSLDIGLLGKSSRGQVRRRQNQRRPPHHLIGNKGGRPQRSSDPQTLMSCGQEQALVVRTLAD